MNSPIVITGMAVNTPLGDTLPAFHTALMDGRSAISFWKSLAVDNVYAKVGGDLGGYDIAAKLNTLAPDIPEAVMRRAKRLIRRAPWATRLSILLAVDAFRDAGLFETGFDETCVATIMAAHNQNSNYIQAQTKEFQDEPDYIDPLFSLHALDTDHGGSVSEVLQVKGPLYTMGGACASGAIALRAAIAEVRAGAEHALVVAPVLDFSPLDLHGMALMGAISFENFNDDPERASRPYDTRREGFVPTHGGGALVVETLERAERRGATIWAKILAVEAGSDGNHLPQPSHEGQSRVIKRALTAARVSPADIDFLSAHATSTPLGDITELASIREAFGREAQNLAINAPKSLLGHTCWSAPTVETIAAILQMHGGRLHQSINIDTLAPEVDLDVCAEGPRDHAVTTFMKNAFGFGGINCVGVFARHD